MPRIAKRIPCRPAHPSVALLLLGGSLFASAQQQASAPLQPHSMFQPPAAAAAASLAASAQGVAPDLLTPGERSGWNKTGTYDEAVAAMRLLEKRSPFVHVITVGETPEHRTMFAMIVSSDKAFTPEAAHRTGKAIILIQSGIHSGEIEGKDTALMLVRDMTVSNKPHMRNWLNNAIFVVLPVFNVDGHEHRSAYNRPMQNGPEVTGLRNTAQNLNLNRDYTKADTPEMRAWLKLFTAWQPDFLFDNHVTDGADYQYDLTYDIAHHDDIAAPARAWVNGTLLPRLNAAMEHDGHRISPYGELETNPETKRREFYIEVFSPRYSHIYAAAHNRPNLLVETHSLKSAKTRAWANYDVMVDTIDQIAGSAEQAQALRKAVRDADAADMALAGNRSGSLYLDGKTAAAAHPLTYYSLRREQIPSPITGKPVTHFTADKEDLETVTHDGIDTTLAAPVPTGFLIPSTFANVADLLRLHGIHVETLTTPREGTFDTWRFTDIKNQPFPYEGRTMVDFNTVPVHEAMTFPAGSFYVPLAQPGTRLIMALLHPAAPDSLAHWGFFDAVFEPTGRFSAGEYLSVPIAEKQAAENPAQWSEFQAKLASDPAFAADPAARLTWWLTRTPYHPASSNRYPVAEVW